MRNSHKHFNFLLAVVLCLLLLVTSIATGAQRVIGICSKDSPAATINSTGRSSPSAALTRPAPGILSVAEDVFQVGGPVALGVFAIGIVAAAGFIDGWNDAGDVVKKLTLSSLSYESADFSAFDN